MHLGTGGDEQDLGAALAVGEDVGALVNAAGGLFGIEDGQLLAAEDQGHRAVVHAQGLAPGLGGFRGIGGTDHRQVGDGAQGRQMLHRLMGGAVLPHGDAVVGEDVDHRQLHDRRHADGRPHVVGEYQERAAIGADAAVQEHAR